jgi:SAM-dependent methyltransferase
VDVIKLPTQNQTEVLFDNPFHIEDLTAFDDTAMRNVLAPGRFGLSLAQIAHSVQDAPTPLVKRIERNLPADQRSVFLRIYHQPTSREEILLARRQVLDNLFWELTYWETPELYEQLTEGEWLHPGIFQQLSPALRNRTVLDAGAGSGRATIQCLKYHAKQVYAVEPSPGLLRILQRKLSHHIASQRLITRVGRFDTLPLDAQSVDVALSCSAFTSDVEQGGEPGLAELKRVTKPGGQIVLIWPRPQDRAWLVAHGFTYVSLPVQQEMCVHFRSLHAALECAQRFYAHNRSVVHYILRRQRPDVPFSVLGLNPPRDYCWLRVT